MSISSAALHFWVRLQDRKKGQRQPRVRIRATRLRKRKAIPPVEATEVWISACGENYEKSDHQPLSVLLRSHLRSRMSSRSQGSRIQTWPSANGQGVQPFQP